MRNILVILAVSNLFINSAVVAQVRLPRLVSDSMILQRDINTQIWGWASAGEKVTVSFNKKTYSTITGDDKKWKIGLPKMKAGGPYTMEINASNSLRIKDILMGDVWVCSGQSNMELPMDRVKDEYPDAVANSTNYNIRQFAVERRFDFNSPMEDLLSGSWVTSNPKSVLNFTAAGYFFAKKLFEKYKVPIALIKDAVGGSPAEAWLSEGALKDFPHYLAIKNKFKNGYYLDSVRVTDNAGNDEWYTKAWLQDKGMQEAVKWFNINYDAAGWNAMQLPAYWTDQGLKGINGVVWFRKEFEVPLSMINVPVKLRFGNVVDRDSIYINGKFVGSVGYQYPPRKYDIPAGLLKPGKNTMVIKVINSSGRGGFYKGKPYYLAAGNDTINLQGEWKYKLAASLPSIPSTTTIHYLPGGLYNGMIAPLLNYSIRGVIWYQGESNTSKALEYQKLFPDMIKDWRQQWKQGNFPFLFVQLANYMESKDQPANSQWAELREAQLETLAVPNTAMVVATDVGAWNDIHPTNKLDVGNRLALGAEVLAYGNKRITYSGPIYRKMKIDRNKIILSFDHTGSGLMAKNDNGLKYFSIAGADKKFVWATAMIHGSRVIVWNDSIPNPVAVRYAWADNPEGANLYNKEGLPASPFKTDQ